MFPIAVQDQYFDTSLLVSSRDVAIISSWWLGCLDRGLSPTPSPLAVPSSPISSGNNQHRGRPESNSHHKSSIAVRKTCRTIQSQDCFKNPNICRNIWKPLLCFNGFGRFKDFTETWYFWYRYKRTTRNLSLAACRSRQPPSVPIISDKSTLVKRFIRPGAGQECWLGGPGCVTEVARCGRWGGRALTCQSGHWPCYTRLATPAQAATPPLHS